MTFSWMLKYFIVYPAHFTVLVPLYGVVHLCIVHNYNKSWNYCIGCCLHKHGRSTEVVNVKLNETDSHEDSASLMLMPILRQLQSKLPDFVQ